MAVQSKSEIKCEEHLVVDNHRYEDGDLIIELPFKDPGVKVERNLQPSVQRMNASHLKFNLHLKGRFSEFIEDYSYSERIKEDPAETIGGAAVHYLPHHTIIGNR